MLHALRSKIRGPAAVTLLAFAALTIGAPVAQAGMVNTDQAFAGVDLDAARARIATAVAREDLRAMFVARGVDPAMVDARVAALSDDEVRTLDEQFERLPAGGDVVGTVLFIFLVLLLTDLLGWTDVFPFTKKGALGD